MGTEVLRPHDILVERFRQPPSQAVFPRRRNRKPEKKRPANGGRPAADGGGPVVMGHVTILRRGESLDSLNPKIKKENKTAPFNKKPARRGGNDDVAVYATGRLGPDRPEMLLPQQIRVVGRSHTDVYAGSAFSNSPSPRSLPFPSFFNNVNRKQGVEKLTAFDDSATRDLRRLLRLDY